MDGSQIKTNHKAIYQLKVQQAAHLITFFNSNDF